MGELHNTYIDSTCNYVVHALNAPGELMDGRHTTLNRVLIVMASIFALVALMGAASATDYYVATWGDNSASGNFTHPWQNVSYATQQAVAGDTIYLFNGTWYNETCDFANSGNSTHQITLTAYNGTPTMRGDGGATLMIGIKFYSYTTISHLTMANYTHCIQAQTGANHSTIADCDLGYTTGTNYGYVVKIAGKNCHYNTIENCSLHDSGWNTIQLYGNREPPNGNGIPATYITVRNCTIYNSTVHNAIDLFGNLQNVTIEGNEFYSNPAGCIFTHDPPDYQENVTIRNNHFHDTLSDGMTLNRVNDCDIYNNTFENILSPAYPIYLSYTSHDTNITNNSFYNCMSPRTIGGYNFVFDRNYVHTDNGVPMFSYGSNGTVRNPLGKKQIVVNYGNATADMEFDDGTLFTATFGGASEYTPVRYYPDKSNCSITAVSNEEWVLTATTYNITLRPTHGHLYDVTVDIGDEATDTYRITASSTQRDNPTWVNLTTKSASATYNITRDGEPYTKATTGADGVLRYRYTGTWDGPQTFEFSYASDGADIPPTARAGSDQTVNVNSSVTLDGSASTGDGITSYAWDFDSRNGIQQDATDAIVTHIYTGPGTYIATLTVTDTSGQTDSDTVLITVIEGTTQTTDVSRITNPIVPDGSLSEWAGADTVTFAGSDNTATVSLTWDTNNLYFGFDVTDTNLQASGTDEADPLHLDDSIEIYLDTNHNGGATMQVDDYHFIINLNGALVDDQGTGSGKNYSWTSHINYAIDLDGTLNDDSDADNGYVVEVAIPWSDIGGVPVAGDIMGLDLAVNDNDGTAVRYFDWCNLSSWAVPDGWGNMTFVESFDNNTLHIADEVTASHGHSATVPIMIYNATGVACAGVKLTYDVSVVAVTGATQGDFTAYFGFDDEHAANGWVTINTYITETQLTGDLIVANVTLEATGSGGDTSPLNLEVISMTDKYGNKMPGTTHNGTFTIRSQPPVLDPVGDKSVDEGQTLSFTISATDPDGDSLTYSAGNLPAGAVFDTAARTFSWTPGYDRSGTYPDVHFEVSDGELADRENIAITVNNVNRAPAISGLVNQSGTAGVAWTYDISSCISDPDGDSLTVAVNDDNVSVIGFALTFNYSVVVEDKPVIITVTDSSLSDSQTIFVTVVENTPPTLTDPSASQPIPDDTDGVPLWGERSTLNITITDDSGIASVTIDLSPIGGSSAQPMNNIGGNIWSVTTNASAGIPPQTYHLQVTATNIYGKSNTSVIPLTVVRNGDTTGDGVANIADAMLLANHASHPDQYTISSEFVADVNGDGDINIVDAMLLANYISYPGRYILR